MPNKTKIKSWDKLTPIEKCQNRINFIITLITDSKQKIIKETELMHKAKPSDVKYYVQIINASKDDVKGLKKQLRDEQVEMTELTQKKLKVY